MTDISAPSRWMFCSSTCWKCLDRHVRQEYRDMSVKFLDQVYADLDDSAVRGIERVLSNISSLRSVERYDEQTIVLTFFDEDDDTSLADWEVDEARARIQQFFGPLWRVQQKHDERYRDHHHPQKMEVRRIVAQEFRYEGESDAHYQSMVAERPDGVPVDAERWHDLDRYEEEYQRHNVSNFFVYTTGSGTQHLLALENAEPVHDQPIEGFARESVYEEVRTPCGTTSLTPQQVADGDDLVDYRVYLRDHIDDKIEANGFVSGRDTEDAKRRHYLDNYHAHIHPDAVLTNFCGACKRALYVERSDGTLAEPKVRWADLLDGGDAL